MKRDELKAFNMPRYAGQFTQHEVYFKSEADKVIAEKDAEIVELKKQVLDYAQGLYVIQARAEKEARHQKYKRCLAMAKWCRECSWSKCVEKVDFYYKWYNRWLELAEKFKPNEEAK
jgi:hypothetical protein